MRKWGFYNRFAWPTEKKCLSNLFTLVPSLSINLTSSCDRKNLHTVKKTLLCFKHTQLTVPYL